MVGTGGVTSTSSELASLPASCISALDAYLDNYFQCPREVVKDYIARHVCKFWPSHQRYDLIRSHSKFRRRPGFLQDALVIRFIRGHDNILIEHLYGSFPGGIRHSRM